MNGLIIEDEDTAARGLVKALKEYDSEFEILSIQETVRGSIDWLRENDAPDLIFMDIQLSDGLSFKIFDQIEVTSPIIFCTAYDEYAVQAFKVNGLDYLLKPVDKNDLAASISKLNLLESRVIQNYKLKGLDSLLDQLKTETHHKNRFLVKAGSKLFYVNTEDIAFFHTHESINYLKTHDGNKYHVDKTIEDLEHLVSPSNFFRINRQTLISIKAILRIETEMRRLRVVTSPPLEEVQYISRHRVQKFKDWLDS